MTRLIKAAPEPANLGLGSAGFVTDEAVCSKLWTAWRGDADVPKVDFQKELVLVFALRGWSKLGTPLMPLDDKGELTAVQPVGTESQGGAGFGYLLSNIPRAGITSVNRTAVVKK